MESAEPAPEFEGASATGSVARSGLQLISRAAAILRAVAGRDDGLSLRQIARISGLPRATVARIVDALEVEQLVTSNGPGGVTLGPAIAILAGTNRLQFREAAQLHLERLAAEVRETVILTVLSGKRAVAVDQVVSDRPVNLSVAPGIAFPLHATAAGKALLAVLPEVELAELLTDPLPAFTGNTVVSLERLAVELDAIRRTGIAFDQREHGDHEFALATGLLDSGGCPYSISILLPETRSHDQAPYVGPLLQCRDRIEAALGRR